MKRRRQGVAPAELVRVRFELGGLTQREAAAIVGVSARTWRRYERGESSAPAAVLQVLHYHATGFPLSHQRQAWHGWRFHDGALYSPEGDRFTEGDVRSCHDYQDLAASLDRELRKARGCARHGAGDGGPCDELAGAIACALRASEIDPSMFAAACAAGVVVVSLPSSCLLSVPRPKRCACAERGARHSA